ncbi:hypothetical protein DAPPUDRAFT_242030 [Daphnia pulex]|uniref:Uncharacterized protein n=1 Tax=Daphnia pulex TaxID=6669 RepID=E9GFP3_DAPPU|nr:hypothetical protein DAPPUDRAFT_242030 [Daphnia pulex]|eukprot:EFX81669.1 hypothetical protein DAPPUDRAFT_242030 [Daphnia pulex]
MYKVTFILALIVAVAVAMPQRPFRPRPGGFQQPGFGGFGGFNNFESHLSQFPQQEVVEPVLELERVVLALRECLHQALPSQALRTADSVQLPEAEQDSSVPSVKLALPDRVPEAAVENKLTMTYLTCAF